MSAFPKKTCSIEDGDLDQESNQLLNMGFPNTDQSTLGGNFSACILKFSLALSDTVFCFNCHYSGNLLFQVPVEERYAAIAH